MDDVLRPSRQMQTLIDDAASPSREIKNLMDALAPSLQVQKLMEDVLAPSRQFREMTDGLLITSSQRLAAQVPDPSVWLSMESQFRQSSVFKIQDEVARGLTGFSQFRTVPDDVLSILRQCAGFVGSEEVQETEEVLPEVNDDGSVTLRGEFIGAEEIGGAIASFFTRVRDAGADLVHGVSQWRLPIKALLVHVVVPIIVNYSVCLYFAAQNSQDLLNLQHQIDEQNAATRRDFVRATKAAVVPQATRLEWRLVTGDALRVRRFPNTRASITTTLRLGTVVRFVEKRRRWTRIQSEITNSGELIEGWVFNKYLTRIR